MKKLAVSKRNILLTAIAFLTIAVLTLSIVLPITLRDTTPTLDTTPEQGVQDVLPSTPSDSVTSDSTLKYSAGDTIFSDHVVEVGAVPTDYSHGLSTAISTADAFASRGNSSYYLDSDIVLTESASLFSNTSHGSSSNTDVVFDGNGRTITINAASTDYTSALSPTGIAGEFHANTYAFGLFGPVNWGTIKNLKIVINTNLDINFSNASYQGIAGIICGWNAGTISNVSVTINSGCAVNVTSAGKDFSFGGLVGVNAQRTAYGNKAQLINVKITNNGTLQATCNNAVHAMLGGIAGIVESGTINGMQIAGSGTFAMQGNSGWRFVAGAVAMDRDNGNNSYSSGAIGFPRATGTHNGYGSMLYTFNGTISTSSAGSSGSGYVTSMGHLFGSSQGKTLEYKVYSPLAISTTATSDSYAASSVNVATNPSSLGIAGVKGSGDYVVHTVAAPDAKYSYAYYPSSTSISGDDTWDGVVAVYAGSKTNIDTSKIDNATNASIDPTYGYVRISNSGNSSFEWATIAESSYWPTNAKIDQVGSVPGEYLPETATPAIASPISTADEFAAMSMTGSYYLTADIAVGSNFVNSAFSGYLDGNGHTITITGGTWSVGNTQSPYDSTNECKSVGGLFARNNGTIRNLNVIYTGAGTVNNSSSNIAVGLLVGGNTGTIKNVSLTMQAGSSMTVTGGIAMLGGLVGANSGTILYTALDFNGTLSVNTSNSNSSYESLGGIVGGANGGSILLSRVTGTPTVANTTSYFGGAVGRSFRSFTLDNFIANFNATNISSQHKAAVVANASYAASGRVYNFGSMTTYVASGTDSLTKIVVKTTSADVETSFLFDNTDNFHGLAVEYVGDATVMASNFSASLMDKYSYTETTPKRVFLTVQTAGEYSWDWTSVLDETTLMEFLARTGSISGANLRMISDITLAGTDDAPIYVNNHTLATGSFIDGGGYKLVISGKVIVADDATGLLVSDNYGTIRDLNLVVTANIAPKATTFGYIAGNNIAGSISNVTVGGDGTLTLASSAEDVVLGGIVGINQSGVKDASVAITIANKLVAESTSGTANVGGIAGINEGAIVDSTVSLTSGGSIHARASYIGIVGGISGTSAGAITAATVVANASSGGGILATGITEKALVGGIAGKATGSLGIDLSRITGGGNIGVTNSPEAFEGYVGGLVGEYASTYAGSRNIIDYKGTALTSIHHVLKAKYGRAFGTVTAASASNMYLFYVQTSQDSNPPSYLDNVIGDSSSTVTIIHQLINMKDVTIVGDSDNSRILVASNTPVMGIEEGAPQGVTYNSVASSAVITPQTTNNTIYQWTWQTSYAGIVNYDETIYYGADYSAVTLPTYTDGWATDYGRVIAGYGVPNTATQIKHSDTRSGADQLLEWLSIQKVEDPESKTVRYFSYSVVQADGTTKYYTTPVDGCVTKEWDRAQYEYAYIASDIRIESAVFFNAQGVLAEGRTLDGSGYTIESAKSTDWNGANITAEIYDYSDPKDAELINSLGLTNLGSEAKAIAVSSGLLAINYGTVKNVTYKVSVQQYVNDASLKHADDTTQNAKGYNWIHGYICGINTGVIENVNVDIRSGARFHTDSDDGGKTLLVGGVVGYNYGGRVSYSSTNIASGAEFNASPRAGGMAIGGVVGLSSGGTLDHLKLSGAGTLKAEDLRKTGTGGSAPYMVGGIVGAMENSATTIALAGLNLTGVRQSSLNYVYNGFTGKYVSTTTSNTTNQHIMQGMIAGRVSSSITQSANNPRINGVMFVGSNNYKWAQQYTPASGTGGYDYTQTNASNRLTPFGGLDQTGVTTLFSGNAVYVSGLTGSYNGYYDYWTRADSDNDGFAIEFEKVASINTVTIQQRSLAYDSTSSLASGSAGGSSSNWSWNRNDTEQRVYIKRALLDGSVASGSALSWSICISVSHYDTNISKMFNIGTLEYSGRTKTRSGTQITSSTVFPLYGSGDYYLDSDVTINSPPDRANQAFTGKIYGNGYTITFNDTTPSGQSYTYQNMFKGEHQGVLTTWLGYGGQILDLNVNYYLKKELAKTHSGLSSNGNDWLLGAGVLTGAMTGGNNMIDNVSINMAGLIQGQQNNYWNGNTNEKTWGVATGIVAGYVSDGATISNIYINHKGTVNTDASRVTASGGQIYRPSIASGAVVGLADQASFSNIILSGSGTISTQQGRRGYSNALIGCVNSSSVSLKNILLWGTSYTMTCSDVESSSDTNSLYGLGSTPSSRSNFYAVNGTSTSNYGRVSYTTLSFYKMDSDEYADIAYLKGSAYSQTIRQITVSNGYDEASVSSTGGKSIYMDAALYRPDASNYMVTEAYVVRNGHRGNIIWGVNGDNAYYTSATGGAQTKYTRNRNTTDTYAHTYIIGTKTKTYLVDGMGNKISASDIVSGKPYDGSADLTAVFDGLELVPLYDDQPDGKQVYQGIKDAVTAGLISATQAGSMLEGEQRDFLKNKYQYSYQIFDVTGTTPLHYSTWDSGEGNSSGEDYVKAMTVASEFVGTYTLSGPQTKTFGGKLYYYFNSDIFVYADSADSAISNVTSRSYTIREATLAASPSIATEWAEESYINFYIPRGEDNAITRFVLYDDVQCTTYSLPWENTDEYSKATMDSVGGYTYTLATEKDRGGTTYYVGAYKYNPTTARYERVASTAIISTMIDQFAPVVGVMRGATIDSDIQPSDVHYVVNADGTIEYGEIELYVRDVSMGIDDYDMYTTPVAVADSGKVEITSQEYSDGLRYLIRCYDSAVFTYTATDMLGRSTTVKFTIDIVKPQLIINEGIHTFTKDGSAYDGVQFINNQRHELGVSSISDNLARTSAVKDSLKWEIIDSTTDTVLFSSDLNGQCYDHAANIITLPLSGTNGSGVLCETARIRVWVTDDVGNVAEVWLNGGKDIVIDTRNFVVRYGESLISKEATFAATPTLVVTEAATGDIKYYGSNSNKYEVLKRFDSFSITNTNVAVSGLTYIGYGVDVNYVNVGDRVLDYQQESLEIGVSSSQVVSLDGDTYSGVKMGDGNTELKIVLFYTVALDLEMALPNTINLGMAADGNIIDASGIVIKSLVKEISQVINNVKKHSSVITSSNFSSYINMVIYDEENTVYYNSADAAMSTRTHIPVNVENSYSITFTIKTNANFDKYYTINTASAVYTLAIVNPDNPRVTFVFEGDTINLKYNQQDAVYGGNWTDNTQDFGFRLKSLLRSAYDNGLLSFLKDGQAAADFDVEYQDANARDIFEDLKYTVLYRGDIFADNSADPYLVDVGTYTVTAQIKSGRKYTGSYTFAINISKSQVTFRPYEQHTVYGNAIASDAYYVKWSEVSIKDKVAYDWTGLKYELLDGVQTVYYLGLDGIKIIVGELSKDSDNNDIVTIFGDIYQADVNGSDVTIHYYKFATGVLSEAPTSSTTQRRVNTYTGYNGIIMTGGASTNYTLYFTAQYAPRLVISRRHITVQIQNAVKYYNGDDPAEYVWQLVSGTFGYSDGVADFVTALTRTYPANGVDNVGDKYAITGTVSNANYNVTVLEGELSVDPLWLNYFVAGADDMYYDGNTDYFGTLDVVVTNAKKSDQVNATIYYQIGYSVYGSTDPIFVDKDFNALKETHRQYITITTNQDGTKSATFYGKMTTEESEVAATHDIEWVKPNTYRYRIIATSTSLSDTTFKKNYDNYDKEYRSCDITGYVLNVVVLDQIITYGSKINVANAPGVTYKLEGVADGDSVHISGLPNIKLVGDIADYSVGHYAGVITSERVTIVSSLGLKYVLNYVFGNLIVERQEVVVDWSAVSSTQVYNGNNLASSFTSGVIADHDIFEENLIFTYYNAAGVAIAEMIDAGGYYVKASLPLEYTDNYVIRMDTEYYYVNIDKAAITLKAFDNSYWNATTDTDSTTAAYKTFNNNESLRTILSNNYLKLYNATGGAFAVNARSLPAEFDTWEFVVSTTVVGRTDHTVYGNGANNYQLPSSAAAVGTYEVLVIVPESVNYYGLAQRVMFVVTKTGGNGGTIADAGSAQATSHVVVSKSSTTINNLAGAGIVTSGHGLSNISREASTVSIKDLTYFQWTYFYFNIELSDEYYMLAQQGLLTFRLKGSVSSDRYTRNAWNWNESDSTAVIIRGIHDAEDYRFGTSTLGESSLNNNWSYNQVYGNMTGWGSLYAGQNDFCRNHQSAYSTTFNMQVKATHAAYRVYLLAYISPTEYTEGYDGSGKLGSAFSNLSIEVSVSSSVADYTMETVNKSDTNYSDSNIYIPTSATNLYSIPSAGSISWVTVSGKKYYFTAPSGNQPAELYANYQNNTLSQIMSGWTIQKAGNYYRVQIQPRYNNNARVWRFTVGDSNSIGINPQTFAIKVKPQRGAGSTEVWSVANGKIHIVEISALYNTIVFETGILSDKQASLEELTVYDYKGNKRTLKEKTALDNNKLTISNVKVSATGGADNYVDFSDTKWYKDAQYLSFTVTENMANGCSGIDDDQIKIYYYDADGNKIYIDRQIPSSETENIDGVAMIKSVSIVTLNKIDTSNWYYISAKDNQGNETIYMVNFHFDDTDESDNISVIPDQDVSLDVWYDGDVTLTTEVGIDLTAGLAISLGKLQYLATDEDVSGGNSYKTSDGWRSMTLLYDQETGKYYSQLAITRSSAKYYMFRFETGAGNYIYTNLGLVKTDKSTPTIDVTVSNTATDNLVISDKWEQGSVTFTITGTIGMSGGKLEYSSAGSNAATWYEDGEDSQPAILTVTRNGNLYTATIVVTAYGSFIESNYAIRFTAGNGKVVNVIFGNEKQEFSLKIDNIEPIVRTDVIAWQSKAQEALIDITENESGIGKIVIEEKLKGSNTVVAFFTLDGAYVGSYAEYTSSTDKYIDMIYDIVNIKDPADFAYVSKAAYEGRVFKYVGEGTDGYAKDAYYVVGNAASSYAVTPYNGNGLLDEAASAADMAQYLTDANVGKYYKYTGSTTNEFSSNVIYKVVKDGESFRFLSAEEGATRTITTQAGRYYFKFDDRDYNIYVYDAVGNRSTAYYTPQVDSYEPTINMVAIQYAEEGDVNFTYHVTESLSGDMSIDAGQAILTNYADKLTKVYLSGNSTASYYVLMTQEGVQYYAYVIDASGAFVKLALPAGSVAYKTSFSISAASIGNEALLGTLAINEIVFYPAEARLQVRTMDDVYGDGVAPEHVYEYAALDGTEWTTNKVKFIVTRLTAGPSGGTLYTSNGVVSTIGQWQILKTVSSFGSNQIWYSNESIVYETTVEGATNYTFFYRSTSNIMVYYNFSTHKSETKNNTAEIAGAYAFKVKIDTMSPVISKPEYQTTSGSYDLNIENKQDWWTTGNMTFRFQLSDGGDHKVTKSGIDEASITILDSQNNNIAWTYNEIDGYYYFVIDHTSVYTIQVRDKVGNYAESIITQYGGSAILVDTQEPSISADSNLADITVNGNWANKPVIFDITASYGDSGATVFVQTRLEDGTWVDYDMTNLVRDPDNDKKYTFSVSDQIYQALTLRFAITNGAGITRYSAASTFRLDSIQPTVSYEAYLTGTRDPSTKVDISDYKENAEEDDNDLWTTEAVDIWFSITDNVGFSTIKCYQNGIEVLAPKFEAVGSYYVLRNVQDTSEYTIVVEDSAANQNINQEYSWNIDAVEPIIHSYTVVSDGQQYTSGTYASKDVVMTFVVGFAVSKVSRTGDIEWSTDGVNYYGFDENDSNYSKTTGAMIDGSWVEYKDGIYYYTFTYTYKNIMLDGIRYRAISKAQKLSQETSPISIYVDSATPTISTQYLVNGAEWDAVARPWATDDVTVNITAQVGIFGGIIEVFKIDESNNTTLVYTIDNCTQDVTTYSYTIAKNNNSDRYFFRVVKNNTQSTVYTDSAEQLVQFDAVTPDIDVTSTYVMGTWTSSDVTLNVTLKMGASYKQTAFYITLGTANETLLWRTVFDSTDLSYKFVDKDGVELAVAPTVNYNDGIAIITFDYVITSRETVNPVVQTSARFRVETGSGATALDTTFASTNSIRIDSFKPVITVGSIVKIDSPATYRYDNGAWSWSDGLTWSNKQVRMTFTLTYYESGATLKYSENNSALISTSVIYGASSHTTIEIPSGSGKYYNAYTIECTLTISTDKKDALFAFVAESGAGKNSVGYLYDDNGTTAEETVEDFSITFNIDMTNPSITNVDYFKNPSDNGSDNFADYAEGYNPERVAYVTDKKIKVSFSASDVLTNGIASGIASVTMTNGDVTTTLQAIDQVYSFFVADCTAYVIEVTDNSGRKSTRTIKIGVDSEVPELAVAVAGGENGVKGYSQDLSINRDDIAWLTEQLTFSFDGVGTKFGTSDGVILYSFDGTNWTTIGVKTTKLVLNTKMTYGDKIYFKAKSNAGKESAIQEVILKLDLKEYNLEWTEKVGSYEGRYANVTLSNYAPYKRGDVIELTIDSYPNYAYNYRIVNGNTIPGGTPQSSYVFSAQVVDSDINIELYFTESVKVTYTNLTQYLKYASGSYGVLTTPVYVRDSHGALLDLDVTYSIEVAGVVYTTRDITILGKSSSYPVGDYTIKVSLVDDDNYQLAEGASNTFEIRYFREEGTQDDPYLIDSAVDFGYINTTIYDRRDAYFAMTKDVILTDQLVLGDFRGNLDGRNYKLTLASPLQQLGLTTDSMFAELSGVVENLGIELGTTTVAVNGNYETDNLYYGFLAEKLTGSIRNSYIVSDMTFVQTVGGTLSGSLYIGGLVGMVAPSGKISRVFTDSWLDVRGLESATSIAVGGLVGSIADLTTDSIAGSFSTATVYAGAGSVVAGMLAPTSSINNQYDNKVVDDNVYVNGVWSGVLGNTTYYQLITPQEYGYIQITMSNLTGRGEPTFVLDLASAKYTAAFDKEPTFANGNLCFEISTEEEFAKINDFLWADFRQVADIELSDIVIALGSVYRGVYDGGGYNLIINNTIASNGLFDRVSGTIKNVNVSTGDNGYSVVATTADDSTVALFVKELIGGTLDEIVIGGDFAFSTTLADTFTVGALVGRAEQATITDIVSTIYVSAKATVVELGALVGRAIDTYIDNTYVVSTVNVNYTDSASIGSVAGIVSGSTVATYYYDAYNIYRHIATGTVEESAGIITSLKINGNVVDATKFYVDDKGILNYNDREYAVIDGSMYEAVGIVEMIGGVINTLTIDGKKYDATRFVEDAATMTVAINGMAYAFSSNTYANGETSERLIGLNQGSTSSLFGYTDLDSLMDTNSTHIISDGVYVRDSLYALYSQEFEAGTGTSTDPFILSEKEDFKKISRYMYAHYQIRLKSGVTALTFEEGEWQTIGVGMNFTGSITAYGYYDGNGYPRSVALYGITDTFIDKNYGKISDFVISVDIAKTTRKDTVFGVVANENYGTIANMDVSGTVNVVVRGAYSLVAGGIAGVQANTATIDSCAVNLTATYRAQTAVVGGAVGRALSGTIKSVGISSAIKVVASDGECTLGVFAGEKDASVTITRKSADIANTMLVANSTTIADIESALVGKEI